MGKGGRCLGLTTFPYSSANLLRIQGTTNSWSPKGMSRPLLGLIYLSPLSYVI